MKKQILFVLFAGGAYASHLQSAQNAGEPDRSSFVTVNGLQYDLGPLHPSVEGQYRRIVKMTDPVARQKALADLFEDKTPVGGVAVEAPAAEPAERTARRNRLIEHRRTRRQEREQLKRAQKERREERKRDARRKQMALDEFVAIAVDQGMGVEQASAYARQALTGDVRAPMAPAMIGPEGRQITQPEMAAAGAAFPQAPGGGHFTQEQLCSMGQHGACNCLADEEPALEEEIVCSVCRDDATGDVVTTSCNHTFHRVCLNNALQARPVCPYCTTPLGAQRPEALDVDPLELAEVIEASRRQGIPDNEDPSVALARQLQEEEYEALARRMQAEFDAEDAQRAAAAARLRDNARAEMMWNGLEAAAIPNLAPVAPELVTRAAAEVAQARRQESAAREALAKKIIQLIKDYRDYRTWLRAEGKTVAVRNKALGLKVRRIMDALDKAEVARLLGDSGTAQDLLMNLNNDQELIKLVMDFLTAFLKNQQAADTEGQAGSGPAPFYEE